MKALYLLLAMVTATPMLVACSASCDCPKCPMGHTTVVTPPAGSTTTTYPNE